jgi:anti-anti-sigma regulatory factor
MDRLRCPVEAVTPIALIRAEGVLDVASAPGLRAVILKCLAYFPIAIVVDVGKLVIDDDIAVTVFASVNRRVVAPFGSELMLVNATPCFVEILDRLALSRFVGIYDDLETARKAADQPEQEQRLRRAFPRDRVAPGQSRLTTAAACQEWGVPHLVDPAMVVVSELVTNAVVHGRGEPEVSLRLTATYLHIAVGDDEPALPRLDPDAGGGLLLVEAFATVWGALPRRVGKYVWAALRR